MGRWSIYDRLPEEQPLSIYDWIKAHKEYIRRDLKSGLIMPHTSGILSTLAALVFTILLYLTLYKGMVTIPRKYIYEALDSLVTEKGFAFLFGRRRDEGGRVVKAKDDAVIRKVRAALQELALYGLAYMGPHYIYKRITAVQVTVPLTRRSLVWVLENFPEIKRSMDILYAKGYIKVNLLDSILQALPGGGAPRQGEDK